MKIISFNGKKAQSGYEVGHTPLYYLAVLVFMLIAIFMLYGLSSGYVSSRIHIDKVVSDEIYVERFFSNCFSYEDEGTGRIYSGIIDWDKFTEKNLDDCFSTQKKRAEITLTNTDNDKTKKITAGEGYVKRYYRFYVLIYDDGKIQKGSMKIGISDY
ncbi:hypothetical protein JW949_02430 [Candidatus Woesearchaeota archaeon]|nr:hypothetical protein [Candidatus Woesearchaeota archaeon]